MSKQNKTKLSFRLTPISVGFLCSTTVLLLVYPALWRSIIVVAIGCILLLSLYSVFFRWQVTPELQVFFDAYSENTNRENTKHIVRGKIFFGNQISFFSVQIHPEGLVFSHSRSFCKLVLWCQIWQIRKIDDDSRFVEVTFVSDPKYNGIKKLVIPWKEDFWRFVPEAKKGR